MRGERRRPAARALHPPLPPRVPVPGAGRVPAGVARRGAARHRPERNQAAGGGPQHHRLPYAQAEAEMRHTPRPRADRKGGRTKPHPPHVTIPNSSRPSAVTWRCPSPTAAEGRWGWARFFRPFRAPRAAAAAVPSGRRAPCPRRCALLSRIHIYSHSPPAPVREL